MQLDLIQVKVFNGRLWHPHYNSYMITELSQLRQVVAIRNYCSTHCVNILCETKPELACANLAHWSENYYWIQHSLAFSLTIFTMRRDSKIGINISANHTRRVQTGQITKQLLLPIYLSVSTHIPTLHFQWFLECLKLLIMAT